VATARTTCASSWSRERSRHGIVPKGLSQQRLGVENACGHARRFHERGFEVIVTDVLTPETLQLYRRHLPGCLIVRLHVLPPEARHRAGT
jgi:hypothetical protein